MNERLDWPLMENNITREDSRAVCDFLGYDRTEPFGTPKLSQGPQVAAFEQEFAQWLGSDYAVMVNSGSSANLITLAALRHVRGRGRVVVPAVTWVSDIAAIVHAGLDPIFVDIDPETLGIDHARALRAITHDTVGFFPTHCLGFNSLTPELVQVMQKRDIPVIEDCCEALGATMDGRKLGAFSWASNFSFYYAHHMSTIEGGMICTDDERLYQMLRMYRSHGLIREATNADLRQEAFNACPDLSPEFIFAMPAYNVRSTELNAVIGREQLKRVDRNNERRSENLALFLGGLNPEKYRTQYAILGSSSYALPLVLIHPDVSLMNRVMAKLGDLGVEFRKGTAGGGNQLRQPYAKERWGDSFHKLFPQSEHVHHFGLYVGNYPDLEKGKIDRLCRELNAL